MEVIRAVRILAAERLNDGILIKFADGNCAFYPAALLHAMLPQAEAQDENKKAW